MRGAVLDVVVDLRVGSPTFGRWEGVRLDDVDRRAVYVAEGLGHGFCALTDDATLTYLCSEPPTTRPGEHAVHPLDPELGIEWPADAPLLSARDDAAPDPGRGARAAGCCRTTTACAAYTAACVRARNDSELGTPRRDERASGRLMSRHGPANFRPRNRVRRHLHLPGAAAAVSGRGGPLPVPPGGVLGTVQQRVPAQRRPALPGRRLPPGVRDARVRLGAPTWSPTTGPASGSSKACSSTPRSGCTTRASRVRSTCSRTTPTPPATRTAATRTTWSPGTASSAGWPTS